MKKHLFRRILAMCMALSLLSTTAFAASFDDLQNAIDGNTESGSLIEGSDYENHYGYGSKDEATGSYGVESWTTDGTTNVTLNENVDYSEDDASATITVGGDVNLDLNGNNITGDGEHDVISVEEDASLTITSGAGEAEEPADEPELETDEPKNTIVGNVYNDGTLSVTDITVDGNVKNNGVFTMTNSAVTETVYNSEGSTFEKDEKSTVGKEEKLPSGTHGADNAGKWHLESVKNSDGYRLVISGDASGAIGSSKNTKKNFIELNNVDSNGSYTISEIEFESSVTSIGNGMFKGCENLTSVVFPENSKCTTIDQRAFENCSELKSVNIPESVTTIGYRAFADCESLASELHLPAGLVSLGDEAFTNCTKLTGDIVIPAGIAKIPSRAFNGCKSLTSIAFHKDSQCTSISPYAFNQCSGLTGEIVIPATVTSIGMYAFHTCENITGVTFSEGSQLKEIGVGAFVNCKLESVALPEGLTTIGMWGTFNKVTSVVFPSTLTNVGNMAFLSNITRSAILYATESMASENIETSVKSIMNVLDATNIYVVNDSENLSFYRGDVTADFAHTVNETVNKADGSVELTNVSGTITVGNDEVTLPDVAGVSVSIDTNGKITVRVPITVGEVQYPNGAIIHPDGTVEELPAPPVQEPDDSTAGDVVLDFTNTFTGTADGTTTIEDDEVPLAGLLTMADLLEELRVYEEIDELDIPEDFQWIDHEYAQAIYWGLQEKLVADTEDDPLDPDELLTVGLMREVLTNYVELYKGLDDFEVILDGEDEDLVMDYIDMIARLAPFYEDLEEALEDAAA